MKISIIGLFARDSSPDGAIYIYLSCGKLNTVSLNLTPGFNIFDKRQVFFPL